MKNYQVKIEGLTPLMHHRMTEESLHQLLGTKDKKKKPKEDITPREIAAQHAYKTVDGEFYIPADYVTGAFIHVSSEFKRQDSQRKSYKTIAGGIFRLNEEKAILTTKKGKTIKDFEVDIRKATNHQKGAVAVCRPRFDDWATEFTVSVDTEIIEPETVLQMLEDAGRRAGIGSFRVAKRGYFGQFQVTRWEEIS